jgi:hypothetical protein
VAPGAMSHGGGEPSLASLIERSAELKRALVDFALSPWLRLLRREVEDLARTLHGERYLREQQARTELARINRELKQLCAQLAALRDRRAALLSELGDQGSPRQ